MRLGTIAFLLGIIALQRCPSLPALTWCWLLPVLLLLAARRPAWRLPALAAVGFFWALLQAGNVLQQRLPPSLEGRDLTVVGRIASVPQRRGHGVRFLFQVDTVRGPTGGRIPDRIRLSWFGHPPALGADQRWRLTVRLKRPSGLMNPGGFDYEGWLFQQRIGATGYVRTHARNRRLAVGWGLDRLRQAIATRLQHQLRGSPNTGVITALAVGERGAISPRQWQLLNVTGTSHLLAISGLHVGLVAALATMLFRWLWGLSVRLTLWWPAAKAGVVAGLAAALGYAALAGFSIPTRRALLMLAVVFSARLLQRNLSASRTLATALLAVLVLDPLAVLAAGFWLSFAAVGVILYGMSHRVGARGWWWRWGRVQWLVAVGLLPWTLLFFQRVSLIAPLANLLAVPWVSLLVVPAVLAGTVLCWLNPVAAGWLLHLADRLLDGLWIVLDGLAHIPLALWNGHVPPIGLMLLAVLGTVVLLAPRGLPGRWLGLVLLLPALINRPAPLPPGSVEFTLLDVGEGLAAVIRTRRHVLVYDTGPRYGESFDAGSAVVLPFLRQRGVGRVDRLIVTHGDSDHIGGLRAILAGIEVDDLLAGVPEAVHSPAVHRCARGQYWQWDGVAFRVLNPPSPPPAKGNNRSCVLRIDSRAGTILLTGDIERPAERRLLRRARVRLAADILVVPHHGSRSSSTPAFVAAVSPDYALLPVGYRNRFRFPAAPVVARYRRTGAQVLDTAADGAISFILNPATGISPPRRYRRIAGRYWNRR